MFTLQSKENLQDYQCTFKHNQPVSLVSLQENLLPNERLYCKQCIDYIEHDLKPLQGVIKIIEEPLKQILKQYENDLIPQLKKLKNINGILQQLRRTIMQELDDLENRVNDFTNSLINIGKQMANYSFFDCLNNLIINQGELHIKPIDLIKINDEWCWEMIRGLDRFQSYEENKDIQIILNQIMKNQLFFVKYKDARKTPENIFQLSPNTINNNNKQSTFEIISKFQLKKKVDCYALAINHDNSLFLVGLDEGIKVMEIQSDMQQQKYNTNQVITLKDVGIYKVQNLVFFKKKTAMLNSFISSSDGCLIIIWSQATNFFNKSKWNQIFKLQQKPLQNWLIRNYDIKFLQLNSEENQITFALNSQIHFLSSSKSWACEQKIQNSLDEIRGLSINPNGNQLVACDLQNITIRELHNSEWKLKQTLPIIGQNFCFINNFMFSFQPIQSQALSIYSFDCNIREYIKSSEIICKGLVKQDKIIESYNSTYVSSKNLLLSINGNFINILQFSISQNLQNYECRVAQSIEFKDISIIGTISDNGEFLIIYDPTLNEIQIRENQDQK
ncbi:unnamed protein product [Paramecium primaurelia]|uniref:WD40-repeat-containing domain n=1 Tax=Paramecium primaurelia TaxID=5886 RepID=A0A8S1PX30_PARPR|nr:unnamed protein product [Paramecium primaurelia]